MGWLPRVSLTELAAIIRAASITITTSKKKGRPLNGVALLFYMVLNIRLKQA